MEPNRVLATINPLPPEELVLSTAISSTPMPSTQEKTTPIVTSSAWARRPRPPMTPAKASVKANRPNVVETDDGGGDRADKSDVAERVAGEHLVPSTMNQPMKPQASAINVPAR